MDTNISLYDILDAEQALQDIGEGEGEFTHVLALQKQEKVSNTIKYIRNIESIAQQADEEAKRLKELSKSYEKQAQRIKAWVLHSMLAHDITHIETSLGKLGIRRSEETIIDNIEVLPTEFKQEKITVTADKTAIKKALHEGRLVEGAHIQENNSLNIK